MTPLQSTFQVLFGTETGNSETLARAIVKRSVKKGMNFPEPLSLAEFTLNDLKEHSQIIVVISTWDQGEPPSAAYDFCEALFEAEDIDLSGLNYCVIALGDESYGDDFCKCGLNVDEHLARLGATQVMETATFGLDFQVQYMGWSKEFFAMLEAEKAA